MKFKQNLHHTDKFTGTPTNSTLVLKKCIKYSLVLGRLFAEDIFSVVTFTQGTLGGSTGWWRRCPGGRVPPVHGCRRLGHWRRRWSPLMVPSSRHYYSPHGSTSLVPRGAPLTDCLPRVWTTLTPGGRGDRRTLP